MKFDKDGKLFVYVKRGYENMGVLCFKLVDPASDSKQYVIGWSTVAEEDEHKFNKKVGKKIAENRADKVIDTLYANSDTEGQGRETLFKIRRVLSVMMYRKMLQVAKFLAERDYYPTNKELLAPLFYEPLEIDEFVGQYFNKPLVGPDGDTYLLQAVDIAAYTPRLIFMEEHKKRILDLSTMDDVCLFFAIGK